jgi:hypothetical protein
VAELTERIDTLTRLRDRLVDARADRNRRLRPP